MRLRAHIFMCTAQRLLQPPMATGVPSHVHCTTLTPAAHGHRCTITCALHNAYSSRPWPQVYHHRPLPYHLTYYSGSHKAKDRETWYLSKISRTFVENLVTFKDTGFMASTVQHPSSPAAGNSVSYIKDKDGRSHGPVHV